MSDDLKQPLPKLRTFAQDLERAQRASGQPMPADVKMPVALPKVGTPTTLQTELKKEVEAAATAPIPAFHELKKQTSSVIAHVPEAQKGPSIIVAKPSSASSSTKKIKVRAKKQSASPEPKIVSGGTIITDTRKGDFQFTSSFFTSIDKWFASLARSFKKKKAPTYSITATDRRKGVIQKATTKTGTIFTADNETLKEEIRRRQAGIGRTDANDGKTEILWSPNTDVGYALLPGDQAATPPAKIVTGKNVTVEFKKRTIPPAPVIVEPTTPRPIEMVAAAEPEPIYIPPTIIETIPPPPEPAPVEIPIEEESVGSEPFVEPASDTASDEPDEIPRINWNDVRTLGDLSRLRTNTIAIGIVGALLFCAVVVIVIRIAISVFGPTSEAVLPASRTTAILSEATISSVAVTSLTLPDILSAIRTESEPHSNVHEVRLLTSTGEALSPKNILDTLAVSVNPNFSQSVSDLHFATIGTKRALVFTVTDTETVFGSLLEWEPSMATDLAAVLGITVNEPHSETFIDQTYRGIDLRILRSQESMIIVYGFIDDTTVVITTDSGVFETLLGQ